MTKLLKPLISLFRLTKNLKHPGLAYRLLPEVYTPAIRTSIRREGGRYVFPEYNKSLSAGQLNRFGGHGELLLKYLKAPQVSWPDSPDEVRVSINGYEVLLRAEGFDRLKVVEEIFIDRLYDFHAPGQFVVLDVGMNVGAASLFFASHANVERVYGYEPFPGTFELATQNFDRNPELGAKIEATAAGLGGTATELEVPLPDSGSLGGSTTEFFIRETGAGGGGKIRIRIASILDAIHACREKHPGTQIILKLDCEGAEYEILDKMQEAGAIGLISVYMIEYHLKGKAPIIEPLVGNGFLVMSPNDEYSTGYGMLYAIKPGN